MSGATAPDDSSAYRGGLARGASFTVSLLLTTSASALLYRQLGVAATGTYLTIIALVALLRGVAEGGITSLAIREMAVVSPGARTALSRNLTGIRLVLTAVFLLPLPLVTWATDTSRTLVMGTVLVVLGAAVQSYQEAISAGLIADGRLGTVALIDLGRSIGSSVTIAAGVISDLGLGFYFVAPLVAAAVSLTSSVVVLRSGGHYVPSLQRRQIRRLAPDLWPLSVATFGQIAYFRLGIVLVAACATAVETGYFAAAFRIVEVLIIVPGIVLSGLLPQLSRTAQDRVAFRGVLDEAFGRACLLGTALAVGLHAGAPLAIRIIAGPDFDPSVDVLRAMALGVAASFPAYVLAIGFATQRMYRELIVVNSSVLVGAVVAYVLLASAYGADGGGVATAFGELSLLAVGALTLRVSRPDVAVSVRPLLRSVAVVAAAAGLTALTDATAVASALVVGAGGLAVWALRSR